MVSASAREDPWAPWIKAVAAGDSDALAALYDASSSVVFGIALRMLGDRGDAEEVALDVYKYVWRNAKSYDGSRATAAAWLIMLTRSRCIDRIRTRDSRERAEKPARRQAPVSTVDPAAAHQANEVRRHWQACRPSRRNFLRWRTFPDIATRKWRSGRGYRSAPSRRGYVWDYRDSEIC